MRKSIHVIALLALSVSACALPSRPSPEVAVPTEAPAAEPPTLPAVVPPASASLSGTGDILFHNGTLLTMDADLPAAQAILIRDGVIAAVGGNDEILALRGEATQVIDLGGLTLMPGFVDAHSHMFLTDLLAGWDPEPSQQQAISYGITTMTEMGMDAIQFYLLKTYAEDRRLRLRLNAYLGYTTNCGDLLGDWWKAYSPNQLVAPNLHVRGLKIFADGGSCMIPAVSVPYPDGSMGNLFFTQDQLNAIVSELQAAGFQVAIHALGDRAVEQSQNAIAAALNGQPNSLRHRIEHNAVVRPDMMARYSEVGILPVIFGAYSTCTRSGGQHDFKYLLPDQYLTWEWPWRALVDANPGLPIAWHADFGPFRYLSPMYIIWGFVTRDEVAPDGSICEAPQGFDDGALRVEEVLPMMTIHAARALFMENEIGSLEPGKLADLVILSDNPITAPTDSLKDIAVLMTMIGGKVEFCAAGANALCPADVLPGASPQGPPAVTLAPVTASAELPDMPAANARDGDLETIWNSGAGPEQWIMLNLGQPQTVNSVHLMISQYPSGESTHQVWVGAHPESLELVHEFTGFTSDPGRLEYFAPSPITGVQFVKIVTTASSSWVAWREIEIR